MHDINTSNAVVLVPHGAGVINLLVLRRLVCIVEAFPGRYFNDLYGRMFESVHRYVVITHLDRVTLSHERRRLPPKDTNGADLDCPEVGGLQVLRTRQRWGDCRFSKRDNAITLPGSVLAQAMALCDSGP